MNINTYRRKFILIAMSAMTACLVLLLLMINLLNTYRVVKEQHSILSILSDNGGIFPPFNSPTGMKRRSHDYLITEESEHRIRYFQVLIRADGSIVKVNLQRIAAVDEEEAVQLARRAIASEKTFGFENNYLFKVYTREGEARSQIIFLDWQEARAALKRFALISATMGAVGLAVTFFIVLWLSKRAIRPVIISTQKQQQFITDASHELKTPLSVISVNMEVLAMEIGQNEWITSTNEQISMLRKLVDQLIVTARLDEEASLYGEKQLLDVSELITDAITCFMPVAEAAGRKIELDIPEYAEMMGNEELLRRLISVLCDNAIKHSSGTGNIILTLTCKPKTIILRVQNPWPLVKDYTIYERMFDRFYKADAARSKDHNLEGFGVGLSIAEKAAQWHGGSIRATPVGTDQICFTVTLRNR